MILLEMRKYIKGYFMTRQVIIFHSVKSKISIQSFIKMICNSAVIVHCLVQRFGVRDPREYQEEISDDEQRIANIIGDLIFQSSKGECEIDEDFYLYDNLDGSDDDDDDDEDSFARPGPSGEAQMESESSSESDEQSSSSSSYQPSPKKASVVRLDQQYTLDQMRTIIEFVDRRGNSAAFKRWSSLGNSAAKIKRIRDFLSEGGHRLSKLDQVKNLVYTKFRDSRDRLLPVHGHDLKAWSIDAARIVKLANFKASSGFLNDLKTRFKVSSRKVTKFVTKKTRQDEEAIKQRADEFVETINGMKQDEGGLYSSSNVWNTDQSGFNYELFSGRTLSDKGEKDTFLMVQNINSLTHSYTIQVLISNDGYLAPKLFICFQEHGGRFGPRVEVSVRENQPNNIVVTCTTSGKLTKSSLGFWVKNCLDPIVTEPTLLLQDSWTTQGDTAVYQQNLTNPTMLEVRTIPPKATKYIQPLDVYFFRQYKIFVRRFQDDVRCFIGDQAVTKLNDRVFIMKMHSFIYNQLSSSRYRKMLIYAWKASGYSIDDEVPSFENVLQVSFANTFETCGNDGCENSSFICCSHCRKPLCAFHCINPVHLH